MHAVIFVGLSNMLTQCLLAAVAAQSWGERLLTDPSCACVMRVCEREGVCLTGCMCVNVYQYERAGICISYQVIPTK